MEKKRPQLNLADLHQLKWLLGGVLAVLSAWTVLYMDIEAWVWLTLITVSVPVVVLWPALTVRVPRWAHRLTFPVMVALFAADFYLHGEALTAMIRLSLMLVLYRAITPRKRRDDLQLILLGLFLVVVAGVLSVSIAFAVQIVVFTGCALLFLLLITLVDAAEAGQPPAETTAASPPAWMHTDWPRLAGRLRAATDWRVAVLSTGLFAGVVVLSALLFFALPRFELGHKFFLDDMISRKSKTGFSENVGFNDVTDIQQDTSVAMRVEVSDTSVIPAEPYWRMLILDRYKDKVFSVSTELAAQIRPQRRGTSRVVGSSFPRPRDAVWTFYLEGGTTRYLPLLGSFTQLQFNDGPQDYAINDELRILRLEKTPPKMFAYRVEGLRFTPELKEVELVQFRGGAAALREAANGGASVIPLPSFRDIELSQADIATLSGWVAAIGAPADDARAFAAAASRWLAANHTYSLQSNIVEGASDPLIRWMGSKSPGHCELFAGSFTLLARAAGYPARMVTGFRGGSWNPESQHLSIRNSDAHAWCEIYDEATQAWVRVDPTPGAVATSASTDAQATETVLTRMSDTGWSARIDAVRMFWYRRIVDFDQDTQMELAREAKNVIKERIAEFKADFAKRLAAIGAWLKGPWDVARLSAWVLIVMTAFALVFGWRGYGRGWWLRWRSGLTRRGVDPVRREAGRWLRKLNEHDAAMGDEDWRRARSELERLRYGPRQTWGNPQEAFRHAKRAWRTSRKGRPR